MIIKLNAKTLHSKHWKFEITRENLQKIHAISIAWNFWGFSRVFWWVVFFTGNYVPKIYLLNLKCLECNAIYLDLFIDFCWWFYVDIITKFMSIWILKSNTLSIWIVNYLLTDDFLRSISNWKMIRALVALHYEPAKLCT